MAELLSIKRELTVIKVQIDGLLDCVDKMDPQRKDCSESSPLTSHVLNGVPAARLSLSLHRLDPRIMIWTLLSVGTTNEDGRCTGLISREAFGPGCTNCALRRDRTGRVWVRTPSTRMWSQLEQRIHLPLLMSRFSYSVYRGS
ncbi:5-hydroxyisourate hydrolase [Dissostichus eleginoides]|uniref:5-hydroxyisourate hydrolase n=1 Tax=Dissostichus eleginoides TaxID=100907 RepID=A0AAD9EZV5_DISEL|nr:5-hydroxyisourate hydrolase [Dissostichus eleginoides]